MRYTTGRADSIYYHRINMCHMSGMLLDRFQNRVEVIEHCRGSIGQDPGLVLKALEDEGKHPETASTGEISTAQKVTQDQHLAAAFLLGLDRN
jgi:hypothetical protein